MTDHEPSRAFVPAHVTAFFAPERGDEPATTGATGAGVALADGIETRVTGRESDAGHHVTLNGERASVPAVENVLQRLDAPPTRVAVEAAVPVGAGFGVSGGAALGTALALADHHGPARTTAALVAVAHAAEVDAGTGLGDVVGAAAGGVPLRLAAGGPDHGRVDTLPARGRIEYVSFGELSTAEVLADDTAPVATAGERALRRLRTEPTLERLFELARGFADEADLLVPAVREAVEAVEAAGGDAAMGMLGRTVVARETGLSDAGYDPVVTEIDPAGARLRE
ncbi:pantoate kinase [Halobaculum sp. MBLA0143]|uniref:pantoate kinase n=1 Tax=Halobaculum sp. MBLA0143 TaxID=3079933 RepID=UPI003524C18E